MDQMLDVGFLGAGYIADWHARALRSIPGARLAAVCDQDAERSQAFALRHGVARIYTSLREMLTDCRLHAIHILLPADLHAQAASEIIEAGIHVLLEKPMATSAEACLDLSERARFRRVKIGVSHNFLFAPIYEHLKNDLRSGKLGCPDEITITWNKNLDRLQTGPFDLWMFRAPQNIMLEVGAHSVAHMLDLIGSVQIGDVRVRNPLDLSGGTQFFRRWHIEAEQAATAVMLNFSFAPGFSEHSIHIRGSLASATADFEQNTYLLHRHTKFGLEFDRYRMTVAEANALKNQARCTLGRDLLSKVSRSSSGAYGESIARALQSFYGHLTDSTDHRLSSELGYDVIRTCLEIGRRSGTQTDKPPSTASASVTSLVPATRMAQSRAHPEILVLGATGFIGQELARQLIAQGHPIRVLVRNASRLAPDLRGQQVEVVVGSLSQNNNLVAALESIRYVYHLARPHVKTWQEFLQHEVIVTRQIAEACLAAQVKRLFYTGTIDSYYAGARAEIINENTPLDLHIRWRNYYAQSKVLSEQALMSLHRVRGLPVVIFRPGIVLGRGGSPFHWGVGLWSWNAVCQIWGQGRNSLPFVLVEDVVSALVNALSIPGIEGESFNLVADSYVNAWDYLQALEACTGVQFQKIPTSPWKFYMVDVFKWMLKRVSRHSDRRRPSYRDWKSRTQEARYDCSKARKLLHWNPTDLRDEIIQRGIQLPALELFGQRLLLTK